MTPTAAPVAAIHRNARPGEAANVRRQQMPAAHGAMRAAKAAAAQAAMASTSTAVACHQSASRHRRQADCHGASKRNTPSTERPA